MIFKKDQQHCPTSNKIKKLVVLDCKWSKTSAIKFQSNLMNLPKVHLSNPPTQSLFWRWHNSGKGMLSTMEAIYYAAYEVVMVELMSSNLQDDDNEKSNNQQRRLLDNLKYIMWLFALQRSIITQRSKEEKRITPFSHEGKEQQRKLRRKQIKNPSPNKRTIELRTIASSIES